MTPGEPPAPAPTATELVLTANEIAAVATTRRMIAGAEETWRNMGHFDLDRPRGSEPVPMKCCRALLAITERLAERMARMESEDKRLAAMLHEVETRTDPAGEVRERVCAAETARALAIENEKLTERLARAEEKLAAESLATCKRRGWSTHWTERGAYLHLEASELLEAVRGKGTSSPTKEAGDVLLVLMSITEANGIPWGDVIDAAWAKVEAFRTRPRYAGEEYDSSVSLDADAVRCAGDNNG